MQETSDLYRRLRSDPSHYMEVRLVFGADGSERGAPETGYDETSLQSVSTSGGLFSGDTPGVGNAVARQIDVTMLKPSETFPKRARMNLYARLTNGVESSEWLPKGEFFIDTREYNPGEVEWLSITGYDAMIKTEQTYTGDGLEWPATDIAVVQNIASAIGVDLDERTTALMTKGYSVPFLEDYSMREYLAYIASMYAGNFIMSDTGQLRLVTLNGYPEETNYLVDTEGYAIKFGGDRILV